MQHFLLPLSFAVAMKGLFPSDDSEDRRCNDCILLHYVVRSFCFAASNSRRFRSYCMFSLWSYLIVRAVPFPQSMPYCSITRHYRPMHMVSGVSPRSSDTAFYLQLLTCALLLIRDTHSILQLPVGSRIIIWLLGDISTAERSLGDWCSRQTTPFASRGFALIEVLKMRYINRRSDFWSFARFPFHIVFSLSVESLCRHW